MQAMGGGAGGGPGVRSFVISRTMQQADHPNTTIVKARRALRQADRPASRSR
jgi:hypothetical protein